MNQTASTVAELARAAKRAGQTVARASGQQRRDLLLAMAEALCDPDNRQALAQSNGEDLKDGTAALARGELSQALVDRLALSEAKLDSLVDGLAQLASQEDLVGRRTLHRALDEGLVLERRSAPLGVLGVVFEARPDAVPQIAGLALRTGNAVVLKGGSEALRSNRALVSLLQGVMRERGFDPAALVLLEDRAAVAELLQQDRDIDLVIARGSTAFVHHVMNSTKIPVLGHAEGLCHLFLHHSAEPAMAAEIAVDAKCSYPAACNSIETLLWEPGAQAALDASVAKLKEAGVELRCCERTAPRVRGCVPASDEDWAMEYGDRILAIKQVEGLPKALEHIERYGSGHTEAIVAEDEAAAEEFLAGVDAAGVFHNASTRFADGYRYGFGAEVGISTSKLHARGPVGVEGLLTYRYVLRGQGQVSTAYGKAKRSYRHEDL